MILLLGADSMIGRAILDEFKKNNNSKEIVGLNKAECNCLYREYIWQAILKYHPTHIISLVGINGNIEMNKNRPGDICGQTVQMNMNVMDIAVGSGVTKVLIPISSCAYSPKELLKESEFLEGIPHPSVESHGYARRFLYIYGQQLNKQYGNRFIFPILNNTFGPHDNFKKSERLKVFGALIQRFIRAKRTNSSSIEIWGTGEAKREGFYVADAARLIIKMLYQYDIYDLPLNLGLGTDISIKELAYLIKQQVDYQGDLVFDKSKPDGQMKKLLDVSRALNMGYVPHFSLPQGILETINWYNKEYS